MEEADELQFVREIRSKKRRGWNITVRLSKTEIESYQELFEETVTKKANSSQEPQAYIPSGETDEEQQSISLAIGTNQVQLTSSASSIPGPKSPEKPRNIA